MCGRKSDLREVDIGQNGLDRWLISGAVLVSLIREDALLEVE